jgi:[ribosomal protein S18]-alanine N-acetyltransferase
VTVAAPPLELAPMRPDDVPAVAALEAATRPRPWSAATFADEAARADRRWVVARDPDGRLVGYAGVTLGAGEAHVLTVVVAPDVRRRGTGRRLVLEVLGAARAAGASAVTLEVRASNVAARALYDELGFVSAGLRPGYYADGEDADIRWLHELDDAEVAGRLVAVARRHRLDPPPGLLPGDGRRPTPTAPTDTDEES